MNEAAIIEVTSEPMETAVLEPPVEQPDEMALPAITGELERFAPAIMKREFLPVPIETVRGYAEVLAYMPGIAEEFRGNIPAVAAVIFQAIDWKQSPAFLLRCAYQAKKDGPIGYEAKALNAVITSNAPLRQRPRYRFGYGGDGRRIAANRFVVAIYDVIGSDTLTTLRSPTVSQIKVKNSPEWFSHTDKQLIYYIGRAAANALFPDVLGGAFSREEVAYMAEQERRLNGSKRVSFEEEEVEGADFEDGIMPTERDEQNFARAEAKANGAQDSRDPRDAKQNHQGDQGGQRRAPAQAPAAEGIEPDDLAKLRAEAAEWQKKTLEMKDPAAVATEWDAVLKSKAWKRLVAYDQPVANAIRASIVKHIGDLRRAAT